MAENGLFGTPFWPQKSPRKSLCGSPFCFLSQERRHTNFFLGAQNGGFLGGGQKSLCAYPVPSWEPPDVGLALTGVWRVPPPSPIAIGGPFPQANPLPSPPSPSLFPPPLLALFARLRDGGGPGWWGGGVLGRRGVEGGGGVPQAALGARPTSGGTRPYLGPHRQYPGLHRHRCTLRLHRSKASSKDICSGTPRVRGSIAGTKNSSRANVQQQTCNNERATSICPVLFITISSLWFSLS